MVFFTLRVSRKVKACSLAENRPADIFLSKIEVQVFSGGPETKSFGLFAMSESPLENLSLVLT